MEKEASIEIQQKESVVIGSGGSTKEEAPAAPYFDPVAEKKLRRKIDLCTVPPVALLFLLCFIDRANIGNARLAGFEADLGLQGQDYNLILSMFYISYAVSEIPCVLLCKYIGPGWFLPLTTLLFGAVTIGTGFCHTKGQMLAVRFVLGIFEAGLFPGISYYLSRWYRHSELVFRLGLYIVMTPLAGAFGGLLASGILTLDSFGSLTRWRMIFAIEGIITCLVAVILLVLLTDRPETARWLSEDEKKLAISRVMSERVGQEEVVDKMSWAKLKSGISNPITLLSAFIFCMGNITVLGTSFFLPTIIRTIYPGRTVVQQQLLTVPPYIVGGVLLLAVSYLSSKLNTRQIMLTASAPTVVAGYAILLSSTNPSVRYAAIFLTTSCAFFNGSLCAAQVSANTVSDTARSISLGANALGGYLGGLIATWTYLPWDGPMYPIGNGLNLAVASTIGISSLLGLFWMNADNKKRDQKTPAEREELLAGMSRQEISDLDWRHPDFRWRP